MKTNRKAKSRKAEKARSRDPSRGQTATGLNDSPIGTWGQPADHHIHAAFGHGYESLATDAIFQRVESDLKELVARAYHLAIDRWRTEPSILSEFEIPREQAKQLRDVRASLQARLQSKDAQEKEEAELQYKELRELDTDAARRSTVYLALLAQSAARSLERLAQERLDLLKMVAPKFGTWPVNLGLSKPKRNGKQDLRRLEIAEDYLRQIEVNAGNYWPETENPNSETPSPFRLAAEQIYGSLRIIRGEPLKYFRPQFPPPPKPGDPRIRLNCKMNISPWGKKLLALQEPMTTANAACWWEVAKVWLDEQWRSEPHKFEALTKHLGFDLEVHTPSLVKRQVVDDSLKKAFKALAILGNR